MAYKIMKFNLFQQFLINDYLDYNRMQNEVFKLINQFFQVN
jgi:hypothetical protein